jgi:hypothetical protein
MNKCVIGQLSVASRFRPYSQTFDFKGAWDKHTSLFDWSFSDEDKKSLLASEQHHVRGLLSRRDQAEPARLCFHPRSGVYVIKLFTTESYEFS